jgi:HlyD family secretion protein
MDIARPDIARRKRRRQFFFLAGGLLLIAITTIGLATLKPAIPALERGSVLTDTVKRGLMICDVHGNGTLLPEEIRWITANTPGRIEKILLLPGVTVDADTVLVELSNPELEQSAFEAESQWHAAEAQLEKLKVQLESERLTQQSVVASLKFDLAQAKIEADADEILRRDGLVPTLTAKKSRSKADELEERIRLEQTRLEIGAGSTKAQLAVQTAEVERARKQHLLKQRQMESLKVTAGFAGVLQRLGDERPLQSGQQLAAGANIARVANPSKLKAEIRVAETQAKDIQHGQIAIVDTRNGTIPGRVVRIDPAVLNGTVTIDIALEGPLPRGARPDLSVEATITLERLENVIYVGRPVSGQAESAGNIFKILPDNRTALRVPVKFGRMSVSYVEIKNGLQPGEQVILSDVSAWEKFERIKLN